MRAFLRADGGTRTPDPFITSEVLYQLSYVGAAEKSSLRKRYVASAPPQAPSQSVSSITRASATHAAP
jgi:hypothetical protein